MIYTSYAISQTIIDPIIFINKKKKQRSNYALVKYISIDFPDVIGSTYQ